MGCCEAKPPPPTEVGESQPLPMQDRFLPLKSEDKQLPPPTEAEPPLPTEASEEQRQRHIFLKQLGCTMFPLHVTELLGGAQSAVKADKACVMVLAAVRNLPEALRFALGALNQDQDCLKASGLWDLEQQKMMSTVEESDTVEIMFDDVSVRREGETMSLYGVLAGDSGIEIDELLPLYDGGELLGFGVLLSQKPVWNGLCCECGKSLCPGTDWYHKAGLTCDLCEEHWLDAEDQEKFVLLADDAKILKYIKQNSAEDDLMAYQLIIPPAIFVEKPEDWEDEQTDEFKNECEKATVGWKGFDSQEAMEAYLQKKLSDEATDAESSD